MCDVGKFVNVTSDMVLMSCVRMTSYTALCVQAEAEVVQLTRSVRSMEEEYESTEYKLQATNIKLEQAAKASEESERSGCISVCLTVSVRVSVCLCVCLPVCVYNSLSVCRTVYNTV